MQGGVGALPESLASPSYEQYLPVPTHIVSGVPFAAPQGNAMPIERRHAARPPEMGRRVFDIRVADATVERAAAGILVDRMYATRGYLSAGVPVPAGDHRITLVASEGDSTIGTITMTADHGGRLLVEDLFGAEVAVLRARGLRLCEFTKLAIDGAVRSRRVLASLFHAAYLYAGPIWGQHRLLIEVNPRHVGYYRRMLGFRALSDVRTNARVDAPAVLMMLDLNHARERIAAVGGTHEAATDDERSLYPWFFGPDEERAIIERARRLRHAIAPPRPIATAAPGGMRIAEAHAAARALAPRPRPDAGTRCP